MKKSGRMNKMKGLITFFAAVILILTVGSANAEIVIDFESLGDLTVVDNQFLGLGADFNGLAKILSRSGSLAFTWPDPKSGYNVISDFSYDSSSSSIRDIRVDAVGPKWLMVGGYVTHGTYITEKKNVTLTAYDSSGNILGFQSTNGSDTSGVANMLLSVSAPNISYVIFSNEGLNTCTVDDFTFAPVPVPAAVLLGMLGLGVAGLKVRKFV